MLSMLGLRSYEDTGYPSWYDYELIKEACIEAMAKNFIYLGRIDCETKEEFKGFFVKKNINTLINMRNLVHANDCINECWEAHCHECANREFKNNYINHPL